MLRTGSARAPPRPPTISTTALRPNRYNEGALGKRGVMRCNVQSPLATKFRNGRWSRILEQ